MPLDVKRTLCLLLTCLLAGLAAAAPAPPRTVVYPRAENTVDERDRYPVQLLTLALRKAHADVALRPHAVFMLQVRAMREVEQQSRSEDTRLNSSHI